MIDWLELLRTPFGVRLDTLCVVSDLVREGRLSWRYRVAPTQYIDAARGFGADPLTYGGFAWFASEGAFRVADMRQGDAALGSVVPPPAVLLPEPGMLNADKIAEYGFQTDPETFSRYIDLTHQVSFGDFRYHYEMVTPRPTDAPIAIEVDRDHRMRHIRLSGTNVSCPSRR
jgi:hypothetical protein